MRSWEIGFIEKIQVIFLTPLTLNLSHLTFGLYPLTFDL